MVPKGIEVPEIDSFGSVKIGSSIYLIGGYDGKLGNFLNSVY